MSAVTKSVNISKTEKNNLVKGSDLMPKVRRKKGPIQGC